MLTGNADCLIDLALKEDIGAGDVTSLYFVDPDKEVTALMRSRQPGVLSGIDVAAEVFRKVDPQLDVEINLADGSTLMPGDTVLTVRGKARSVLTAERTALNFIQRLSGVATVTARYVALVAHTPTRLLDTRKTTPGYRLLEKKAVADGGGTNHRLGLYDRAMVKDNHLMAGGNLDLLQAAIHKLKADHPGIEVQLEADNLDQYAAFLKLDGVDYILLDNMDNSSLAKAVAMRGSAQTPKLEASGGVTISTIAAIAETGVDFISVGALTHSAPSLDLGLDFI